MLHLPRTGFQWKATDNIMAQAFWHLTPVERAAALFFFTPHSAVAQIVYDLKYADRPDIGEDMGRLMANEMRPAGFFDGIDALLPLPLARNRLRQRGYNQSEQLAVGISQLTGLPVIRHAVSRKAFTESQTRLTRQERRQNVDDMFVLHDDKPLRHRHVLIIDDVCTTGATITALSDAIRHVEGIRMSVLTLGYTKVQ
jgi:ComF family protein